MSPPWPLEVTIISSVQNEEGNLRPLVERTVAVMERYPQVSAWEYLLVDDGSTDGSGPLLDELQAEYLTRVRVIHHPQRRGQKGCFMTGFAEARGRLSILMDADLQVLPEELPRVLDRAVLERQEMVCTYNDVARGGKRSHIASQIGNLVMRVLFASPVRNAGGNLMAVETRFVRGVRLIANDQRYLLPIAMRRGLRRIAEVGCVFEHRAYGRSKYSYWKKVLFGFPEMCLLKYRLLTGCYDLPPVPPPAHAPSQPVERLSQASGAQALQWVERAGVDEDGRRAVAGMDQHDHVWALTGSDGPVAVAAWRPNPWDSQALEISAGRISAAWSRGTHLERYQRLVKVFGALVSDAGRHGVRFLSLRLPEQQLAALHAAEHAGFRTIESYLTFRLPPERLPQPNHSAVRLARPEEVDEIAELAARAFRHNRYLSDPLIPEAQARQTRRLWIQQAFKGRADATYVVEQDGRVAGFVVLRSKDHGEHGVIGLIDLLAVDEPWQGRGIGAALVAAAGRHYAGRAAALEAGTQGKNLAAVELYTKLGFLLARTELSLHWHRA